MPLVALLILTVVGAFWTYRDAAMRGMNARIWALVMVLTSCLALPVYLLVRKPRLA